MAASMTYRRYGPMGGGVEIPQAPPAPRPYLGLTAGDVLRRVERRAYDEEPILERTRQALKSEARSTGIAGATGSYSDASRRVGYGTELSRIAGPREVGALARAYKAAWGQLPPELRP